MPIKDVPMTGPTAEAGRMCRVVEFGSGDVAVVVQHGNCDHGTTLKLRTIPPVAIGSQMWGDKGDKFDPTGGEVALVFTKPESVEMLARQLGVIYQRLLGENPELPPPPWATDRPAP